MCVPRQKAATCIVCSNEDHHSCPFCARISYTDWDREQGNQVIWAKPDEPHLTYAPHEDRLFRLTRETGKMIRSTSSITPRLLYICTGPFFPGRTHLKFPEGREKGSETAKGDLDEVANTSVLGAGRISDLISPIKKVGSRITVL